MMNSNQETYPNPPQEHVEKEIKTNSEMSDKQAEKKWYVIRVQSGKEDRVKSNLVKRVEAMNAQDKITRVLVPTELLSEIRKGFKRVVERKLYPGYVMVEMIMNDENSLFDKINTWSRRNCRNNVGD